MHVVTVAWDQLININYAFLNSAKCKILEIRGSRVGIYYVSFFLKFLQFNNSIPYLLAAKIHFSFIIFVRKLLENKAFWTPPLLTKLNMWKQNWLRCTRDVLY